jgi:hypothetical protein
VGLWLGGCKPTGSAVSPTQGVGSLAIDRLPETLLGAFYTLLERALLIVVELLLPELSLAEIFECTIEFLIADVI